MNAAFPPVDVRTRLRPLTTALLLFIAMTGAWSCALAEPLRVGRPLCHAVAADGQLPAGFACAGEPTGYQDRTLWLRADLSGRPATPDGTMLLIHQTRFAQLQVMFRYADGQVIRQGVRRGDFGARWRLGGQIAFEAPPRAAALDSVTIAISHLTSHNLLRVRLFSFAAANRDLATVALLTGGSLILLLGGGIYNLSLSIAVRRRYLTWHGLWAICVLVWGVIWSQAVLIVAPAMAGSASSQVCTFLACLAVGLATMSAVTALGGFVPRLLRRCTIALGVLVVLIGIPGGLTTGPTIELLSPIMAFLTLADLAAVALCLILSDRRGSDEARDLAKTWTVPMAALALTMFVDLDTRLFGGGSQIAVLFASALQSIWLSIAVTPRLAHLRVELDAARQAEAALAELASRDPLTGLLNRRGFVQQLEEVCPPADRAALGLMLVDVDLFKSINDRFGHECGDAVLQRLADCFRAFDEQGCITGRMGGEEFVIAVRDLSPFALEQLAERIRSEVAACDHGEVSRYRAVTVSIGVAQGLTATPFQKLYSTADRALYEAKRSGRNRVVFPLPGEVSESREAIERDQLSFPWPEPAAR